VESIHKSHCHAVHNNGGVDARWKLDRLIWVICISLGFYGVKGGIFTLLHGGIYSVNGPPNTMIEGNNELAFALIMTLPLMRYLQLTASRKAVRLGLWAAMGLTAFSILGSYSRGAFLAGAAMALVLAVKSRKRISIVVVMAILIPRCWPLCLKDGTRAWIPSRTIRRTDPQWAGSMRGDSPGIWQRTVLFGAEGLEFLFQSSFTGMPRSS